MNAKRLLPVSLVLNLCLLAAAGWLALRSPQPKASRPAPETSDPAVTASIRAPANEPAPAEPPKPELVQPARPFDWHLVESADYKKYIANLRAIGCPEETIRDIISADVKKLFDSRRRSLAGSTNKFEYWKAGNFFASLINEEKMKQGQELAREKRELLTELLGTAPEEKPDMFGGINPYEALLDFLPADKQASVAEVYQKYQAKLVKNLSGGTPDAEDLKKIQGVQKEMEAELGKVLTPDELQNYQLRMSQTAMVMRMQLASFDPSEQEFRDIFQLKKSFDDQYGSYGMLSQDKAEKEKYNSAKKELDTQIKSLLGDTRYQEYERAQDYSYQGIYRVADRNGLGKDVANQIYDMKKAAEDQANKVRADNNLTPDQRMAALQGIRNETETSIHAAFGDKAWKSYQNQPAAIWLRGISPDPK